MNNTLKALLQRGIDSIIAERIVKNGYSLKKLKIEKDDILLNLGLTQTQIKFLKDDSRPPIPIKFVNQLLYESNYTCCICKDRSQGVIIHHINEWHISKSHNLDNLVVLCPNHHDKAHSHSNLSLNLTKSKLMDFKKRWIVEVKHKTSATLREKHRLSGNRYDFINIKRLLEFVSQYGIQPEDEFCEYLQTLGILDCNGLINGYELWNTSVGPDDYLFSPFECNYLYLYLRNLLDKVLERIDIKDLNDLWRRNDILQFVNVGDFITYTGGCYLKKEKSNLKHEQPRLFYAKKRKIKISSEINAFWATSSSAYACFLSGHQSKTFIGQVLTINKSLFGVELVCSAIGIGNNFFTGYQSIF